MKPVTLIRPPAYRDLREQPPDPWGQMFEEHREMALKPEHPWYGGHYLCWALIAVGVVLGCVVAVLWP